MQEVIKVRAELYQQASDLLQLPTLQPWLSDLQQIQRHFVKARWQGCTWSWLPTKSSYNLAKNARLCYMFLGKQFLLANSRIHIDLGFYHLCSHLEWQQLSEKVKHSYLSQKNCVMHLSIASYAYPRPCLAKANTVLNGFIRLGLNSDQRFFRMLNDFLSFILGQGKSAIYQCGARMTYVCYVLVYFPRECTIDLQAAGEAGKNRVE